MGQPLGTPGSQARRNLLTALCAAFPTAEKIHAVMDDLGFPPGQHPAAGENRQVETLWRSVLRDLDAGRVVGGPERLLQLALEEYPANPVFRSMAGRPAQVNGAGDSVKDPRSSDPSIAVPASLPSDDARSAGSGPVPSIFLSYSRVDRAIAQEIRDRLVDHGCRVWLDVRELRTGDSILESISRTLDRVDFVIPLISASSIASRWCQKELALAMAGEIDGRGCLVLPLRIDDIRVPLPIVDKLYLDVDPGNVSETVDLLVRDIYRHFEERS